MAILYEKKMARFLSIVEYNRWLPTRLRMFNKVFWWLPHSTGSNNASQRAWWCSNLIICIHNKYEHLIEPIPDGGNRIVGIRLNTTPPILMLCVYLPCRGNSNTDLFQETLEKLSEILEKYKNKANILLGGDMNASLRRDSAQDRQFKCFLNENDMKVPPKCTNSATF